MNRKNLITAVITAVLVLGSFAGCELFEGAPERDNLNDPDNTLGIDFELNFTTSNDSIEVSWNYEGSKEHGHEIYYSLEDNIESAEKTDLTGGSDPVLLEGLQYGDPYHIWLRSVEYDSNDTYFIIHDVVSTEAGGKLDSGFSEDGIHIFPDNSSNAFELLTAEDGSFYVGGSVEIAANQYNHLIYNMNTDGSLNNVFGGNEKFQGTVFNQSIGTPNLILLESDTQLRGFYLDDGIYLNYYPNLSDPTHSSTATFMKTKDALLDSNGRVIVCGSHNDGEDNFSIKRLSLDLNSDDDSFIIDNDLYFTASSSGSNATSMALSDDGKIFVAGYGLDGGPITFLGKFNQANLSLEGSFTLPASWYSMGENIQTAVTPEGKVLLAAYDRFSQFDPDTLQIDDTFGTNGNIEGIDNVFIAYDVKVQSNGKILLAGELNALQGCLYRFNSDGTFDEGFGTGGQFLLDNIWFSEVEVLTDGHIAITGKAFSANKGAVILLK